MRDFAEMQRQIPKNYLQQPKLEVEVGSSYGQRPFDCVENSQAACHALVIEQKLFWWASIQEKLRQERPF
jgi:hypothetical protein